MDKKVFKIFLIILLCIAISLAVLSTIMLSNRKNKIKEMKDEIVAVSNKKEALVKQNEEFNSEYESLKEEKKLKVEDEETWNETIEKLNQALSS